VGLLKAPDLWHSVTLYRICLGNTTCKAVVYGVGAATNTVSTKRRKTEISWWFSAAQIKVFKVFTTWNRRPGQSASSGSGSEELKLKLSCVRNFWSDLPLPREEGAKNI
jgi:hypothetical protein